MLFQDLTGKRFNRLIVVQYIGQSKRGQSRWLCLCDCGNEHEALGTHLKTGNIKSCGCMMKENRSGFRHGAYQTPEYNAYHAAKKRCDPQNADKNPDWAGRGIEFRFTSFEDFFSEVGSRPSSAYTLDRKDNDGHYEKGNLRWATRKQQARNRRCDNCAALERRIAELEKENIQCQVLIPQRELASRLR
jgi:hypothetical protein